MRIPFRAVAAGATCSPLIHLVPASPVKPYASLPRGHQRILQSLRQTLERGTAAAASSSLSSCGALVACAVSSGDIDELDDCTCTSSHSSSPSRRVVTWTTGVNFALHRALLREAGQHESCTARLSSQQAHHCGECCAPLKGLLKGCAEQNALGSFAAQGNAYHAIRHVFLQSVSPRNGMSLSSAASELCSNKSSPPSLATAAVRSPCPECWGHLCNIAQRVQRATSGGATLTLHLVLDPTTEFRGDSHVPLVWDPSLLCRTLAAGKVAPAIQFVASDTTPPDEGG